MPSSETCSGMSAQGSSSVNPYITIGPVFETYGYGWGAGEWGEEEWGT